MIDFDQIGKYKVTEKLGQGSFGVVYKGRDPHLKRDVAIKVCSVEDESLRQRFFREAEISGRLTHKNIVTVFEFGLEDKVPYLVQEVLSGEDLSRIVKRRSPLAPAAKLEILLQVANGLGYAHAEGVIHRDIKPANIRVLEDGSVKIMDFGIAKLASAETQLTQKGVTMGTASYLPPEQVRGSDLDHRADLFSFGVLAYELMTYERPFRGTTLSALVYQILYKVPQPMIEVWPESPEPLSKLVARCLEKKPERRYDSFAELIPELTAVHEDVVAGKWPALAAGPEVAEAPAGRPPTASEAPARQGRESEAPARPTRESEIDEPSDVLSQTAITETARGVLEGKVGDFTISTAMASEILRPAESEKTERSTQPIEMRAAEPQPPAARPPEPPTQPSEADTLKTRILPTAHIMSQPPDVAPSGDAGRAASTGSQPAAEQEDLAMKAQEISDLVAQGRLQAAKEQLEATINKKDLTEIGPAITPTSPPPDGPLDAVASDTYRTMLRPPFDRFKWAGLAAAVVLALGLGWWVMRGREPAIEPEPEPVPAAPIALSSTAAPPVPGGVFVNTATWAEITEITDADGYLQELPEAAVTPFYLELPPGSYKIQLRDPAGVDVRSCDLEVMPGEIVSCIPTFGETRVTDYFKESGWWK